MNWEVAAESSGFGGSSGESSGAIRGCGCRHQGCSSSGRHVRGCCGQCPGLTWKARSPLISYLSAEIGGELGILGSGVWSARGEVLEGVAANFPRGNPREWEGLSPWEVFI